jgi:hypothetical protein
MGFSEEGGTRSHIRRVLACIVVVGCVVVARVGVSTANVPEALGNFQSFTDPSGTVKQPGGIALGPNVDVVEPIHQE